MSEPVNLFGFVPKKASGADFTPICKYDARAGRMFRIDRVSTPNGFVNEPIDITATFKAVFDFENIETGWMAFPPQQPPSFEMLRIADLKKYPMPAAPSQQHKNGVRLLIKLNKACGGERPVREIAGTAASFLSGIEEVYAQYLTEVEKYPGQLPVVVMNGSMPIKTGSGAQSSTNYRPKFRIDGWVTRPEDLIYLRTSDARSDYVEPLKPTPPFTGSAGPTGNGSTPISDDDFG